MDSPVTLADVLAGFSEPWSPRPVATVNDYEVRVFKAQGEFTRHAHPDTDEFFLVLEGELRIRMDDGEVVLGPGQVFVVPKGVAHQPVSEEGARALLFEPAVTVNTGDTPSELTVERRLIDG
jgi:mannose-6-phosphate isomerase-like protein (cupin superfamily)